MANDVEDLLAAEQAVQDVLEELQRLKKEVGRYDTAKQSLEAVRTSLSALVERTSSIAEGTHAAVTALAKIGMPELLARTESVLAAIREASAGSMKELKNLRTMILATAVVSATAFLISMGVLVKLLMH